MFPWAGSGPGPVWVADPERPEWSLRSKRFIQGLRSKIDLEKPNLDVLMVDRHMNEPEFGDSMARLLDEMLSGTWKKGNHGDQPDIVPL